MTNREKIKNILIEELSKCNNFNYDLQFGNLNLKVNTKKIYPNLVNFSIYFEGGIRTKWRFDHWKNSWFWLSREHIWSKFEKETGLNYGDIQQHVKSVLEEGFELKRMTSSIANPNEGGLLEEGFNLKGMISASFC